jgi:hypothetical protein
LLTSPRKLILFCVAVYLVAVAILFVQIRARTQGHFTYALDDAYIHLALSENLAHGHYGINPSEYASPSSSILWPFLLIPFAGTAFHPFVPLAWNLLFGIVAAALIGRFVALWPPLGEGRGEMPFWQQAIAAALLIAIANLPSLTFVGMEHVLQVLLSIACATGIAEALSDRPIPTWTLFAAAIAPLVRYEDLALSFAVAIALYAMGSWRKAAALMTIAILPLLAFSAFLHSLGLPLLPVSVLVKADAYQGGSALGKPIHLAIENTVQALFDAPRIPFVVLFLLFAALSWQATTRQRRLLLAAPAILAAGHLLVGRFGWFHRYEIYALIFLVLLTMRILAERPRFLFGYFALGLACCAAPYIEGMSLTPYAAADIYKQQHQMHRFVTEFYHGTFAVNDLGQVSFERTPGTYVLDVGGLASVETSRQQNKTADWLQDIVARHHADLAILYPGWFSIPDSWTAVGKMCVPDHPTVLSAPCVVFYSTNPAQDQTIRTELQQFAKTLPPRTEFFIGQMHNEKSMWLPAPRE